MIDLVTQEEAEHLLAESSATPVFIFKHSTRCPMSAAALAEFTSFLQERPDLSARAARVLVIENRPVSQWLAQRLNVPHASPQVLLVVGGSVAWHASHDDIGRAALESATDAAAVGRGVCPMEQFPPSVQRRITRLRWAAGLVWLGWLVVAAAVYWLFRFGPPSAESLMLIVLCTAILGVGAIVFIYLIYRLGEVANEGVE